MKKIVIVANCQSLALRNTLLEVLPDWSIIALAVHIKHPQDVISRYIGLLREADVIVFQPVLGRVPNPKVFEPKFISSECSPSATLISFPSLYFKGQHPCLTQLRNEGVPMETPGFVYHEGLIAEMVNNGASDELILTSLKSRDLLSSSFVERQSRKAIDELAKREAEAKLDVCVSGFIENYVREEKLFHTFNHPTRRIISYVTNQLLEMIGERVRVPLEGADYLSYPSHPILPSTAVSFGGKYSLPCEDFRWQTRSLSFDNFILAQARKFRAVPSEILKFSLESTKGWKETFDDWRSDAQGLGPELFYSS